MAYQYPGTSQPQPVFPIRRANIPSIHSHSARNGMTRKSNDSDDSENRLPEDVYAQVIEESNQWAKAEDAGLVYRWNGNFWEEVTEEACQTAAFLWLRERFPDYASDRKAGACFKTARLTMPRLPASQERRCIIPCLDGWLELKENKFVRVAPDQSVGVTYAINAKLNGLPLGAEYQVMPIQPGLFDNYLKTSLPDLEVREMVQEYIGYTLIPSDYLNLQVAMVFIGNGGDGKGVLAGLARRLHRKTCAMNLKNLEGFGAEGLVGATLALVDEGPTRGVVDDERIKTMISGDTIDINRKNRPVLTYLPVAKWIISANETPRFGSAGQAIDRRFMFAPWVASLNNEQRIPNLEGRIAANEMISVLDWALAGALALLKRGRFTNPDLAAKLKKAALQSMDTVLGWKEDADPRYVPALHAIKDDIYQDYKDWCQRQGQGAVRAEVFWKRLRQHIGIPEEMLNGPRLNQNGVRFSTVRLVLFPTKVIQSTQTTGSGDHGKTND